MVVYKDVVASPYTTQDDTPPSDDGDVFCEPIFSHKQTKFVVLEISRTRYFQIDDRSIARRYAALSCRENRLVVGIRPRVCVILYVCVFFSYKVKLGSFCRFAKTKNSTRVLFVSLTNLDIPILSMAHSSTTPALALSRTQTP